MKNNIDIKWEELGFNIVNTKSMYFSKCKYDEDWKDGSLIPLNDEINVYKEEFSLSHQHLRFQHK